MGYYTNYSMEIRSLDGKNLSMEFAEDVLRYLKGIGLVGECSVFDEGYYLSRDCLFFYSYDAMKWYEYEEDMIALSKAYPNAMFMLHGDGEDSMDIWNLYCLNGKTEFTRAEIPQPKTIPWNRT